MHTSQPHLPTTPPSHTSQPHLPCTPPAAGATIIYVNQQFPKVTGYSKADAQGRNCCFLQGPGTEPRSVHAIQTALRGEVAAQVKITNYRKSGEAFENLLTLQPVHDSNGGYRFCIGVQFDVSAGQSDTSKLGRLTKLVKLLPSTIEVPSALAAGDAV
jgi:PAS domain S-box-containing protein